jgi:cobalt-zinc-cadmium efflux system protein
VNEPGHKHGFPHDTSNLRVAFFLNFGFTIVELIGGLLTNSVAILADAIHDLGDTVSLGLAWRFQNIAQRDRDNQYTYGYGRFSVLAAIINSLVLVVGVVFVLMHTFLRFWEPEQPHTTGMIWLAILGVIVNGVAVLRVRKGTSLNERVISIHLMEDVLGWVAVLIGAILMHFYDVPWLDPLMSMAIMIYVVRNVVKNLRVSFRVILQGTPVEINLKSILEKIKARPDVLGIADYHIWSMDGEYNVFTLHILVSPDISAARQGEIKIEIRECLSDERVHHLTVEFEFKKPTE